MHTLERPFDSKPMVDQVANKSYELLSFEARLLAENLGLGEQLVASTFGLLDDLHQHDEESALGGLRTMPIAMEAADEITTFYDISFDRSVVFVGSLLHDIGKIGLSKELLQKSSTGLEWTPADALLMRSHAVFGGAMLAKAEFPKAVVRVVEEHHHKQLGGNEYGADPGLSYEERICRDATAIADFAEADLNRTNSRNRHLSRHQREQEIAQNIAYVLGDYSDSASLAERVINRTLNTDLDR